MSNIGHKLATAIVARKAHPAGPPEKRRKGPGRPPGSTKAAKNTKDIQDMFNGLYEG